MGDKPTRRQRIERRMARANAKFERQRHRRGKQAQRFYRRRMKEAAEADAHEAGFRERHRELIANLELAGHRPDLSTEHNRFYPEGPKWVTNLRCEQCGETYRGKWASRWRGLSPRRRCEPEHIG